MTLVDKITVGKDTFSFEPMVMTELVLPKQAKATFQVYLDFLEGDGRAISSFVEALLTVSHTKCLGEIYRADERDAVLDDIAVGYSGVKVAVGKLVRDKDALSKTIKRLNDAASIYEDRMTQISSDTDGKIRDMAGYGERYNLWRTYDGALACIQFSKRLAAFSEFYKALDNVKRTAGFGKGQNAMDFKTAGSVLIATHERIVQRALDCGYARSKDTIEKALVNVRALMHKYEDMAKAQEELDRFERDPKFMIRNEGERDLGMMNRMLEYNVRRYNAAEASLKRCQDGLSKTISSSLQRSVRRSRNGMLVEFIDKPGEVKTLEQWESIKEGFVSLDEMLPNRYMELGLEYREQVSAARDSIKGLLDLDFSTFDLMRRLAERMQLQNNFIERFRTDIRNEELRRGKIDAERARLKERLDTDFGEVGAMEGVVKTLLSQIFGLEVELS
ncbi:MAG: hypothetical protein KGH60_01220 [Candidatus Micrarchaeota archaeon]|nr:hypothetical protein [Candidatus Micrarchaeota archaeon]